LQTPELWKKAVAKATLATGNVVTGAASVAVAAALWNPLPLILWGLGSVTWVFLASTSKDYAGKILAEERREREAREEAERAAQRRRVEAMLAQEPFASWAEQRYLPDYLSTYDRLVDTRARIVRIAKDRPEVQYIAETGIAKQLGYMLSAFLEFVLARTTYLQVLSGIRAADPGSAERGDPDWQRRLGEQRKGPKRAAPPLPSVDERLAQLDRRILELRELAKTEPATAKTREWHAQIVEKQRALLVECRNRDQQVVAQLAAFPDMFEVIAGRVSASQFDEREIAQYMGGIVREVEETSKFVQEMRPAMDEVMIQLEAGAA
jgi:hypothetical protein